MKDLQFHYLTQLAFGYWNSHPLFTLTKLNIFDHLNGGSLPQAELKARTDCANYSLESLLNAGVALKLLQKENGHYSNSPIAKKFLVTDSPSTLVNWIKVMNRWTQPWSSMEQAIATGEQIEKESRRLGEDSEYLKEFILGMHEFALTGLEDFKSTVAIEGKKKVLDIGGGAGTYAIGLCQANPELEITILDLEPVLEITREVIGKAGLEKNIDVGVIDYTNDSFGDEVADAILLSNVLHQESPQMVESILQRSFNALKKGGEVIVQGHFLDDNRTSPLFTTLHNLSAIILWNKGQSYTIPDMTEIMKKVGFSSPESVKIKNTELSVIKAKKI